MKYAPLIRLALVEALVVVAGAGLLHLLALAISVAEPKIVALSLAPPTMF